MATTTLRSLPDLLAEAHRRDTVLEDVRRDIERWALECGPRQFVRRIVEQGALYVHVATRLAFHLRRADTDLRAIVSEKLEHGDLTGALVRAELD